MENYVEWSDRKRMIDLKNRYSTLFKNENESMFYIEPPFYTGLMYFKEQVPERFQEILDEIDRVVDKYRLVVFTGDEDSPLTIIDDGVKAIYLTITDITDRLNIFVQDKNFQGDYKD